MPKIKAVNIKGLLIRYLIKITVTSAVSILLLNCLISFIILKLDIDLEMCKYASEAVVFISAFIISYFSIGELKNNFLPLSVISVLPLLILCVINYCINGEEIVLLFIKIALVIFSSVTAALLRLKAGKR